MKKDADADPVDVRSSTVVGARRQKTVYLSRQSAIKSRVKTNIASSWGASLEVFDAGAQPQPRSSRALDGVTGMWGRRIKVLGLRVTKRRKKAKEGTKVLMLEDNDGRLSKIAWDVSLQHNDWGMIETHVKEFKDLPVMDCEIDKSPDLNRSDR